MVPIVFDIMPPFSFYQTLIAPFQFPDWKNVTLIYIYITIYDQLTRSSYGTKNVSTKLKKLKWKCCAVPHISSSVMSINEEM
jgi:hypothetical protein